MRDECRVNFDKNNNRVIVPTMYTYNIGSKIKAKRIHDVEKINNQSCNFNNKMLIELNHMNNDLF